MLKRACAVFSDNAVAEYSLLSTVRAAILVIGDILRFGRQ